MFPLIYACVSIILYKIIYENNKLPLHLQIKYKPGLPYFTNKYYHNYNENNDTENPNIKKIDTMSKYEHIPFYLIDPIIFPF